MLRFLIYPVEFLIYPVSGIMKMWHILLHSVLGLSDSTAWMLSIFGLIIVVRLTILPPAWMQYRAGRIYVNLRPKLSELEEEFQDRTDAEADDELQKARRKLFKDHDYRVSAGCVPTLIQLPMFMGLYQVLLRMARPTEGLHATTHAPIGFLTSNDVATFLEGRVGGVPMPAYVAMTDEQFTFLNTNHDAVFRFALPFFISAAIFMSVNMVYSMYRNLLTMDYKSSFAVGLYKATIVMAFTVPVFPISFGLTGPAPVAISLYWFANSLWTMTQYITISKLLDKHFPLTPEYEDFRELSKQERRDRVRKKRAYKWGLRRRRLLMVLLPHRIPQLRAANRKAIEDWEYERYAARTKKQEIKDKRREAVKIKRERERMEREANKPPPPGRHRMRRETRAQWEAVPRSPNGPRHLKRS